MPYRIHREGKAILIPVSVSFALLHLVLGLWGHPYSFYASLAVSIPVLVFGLQFFRNPERRPPQADGQVLCPADGKVVVLERKFEQEYLNEERLQLSIFMSPFNVHVNRSPIDGEIEYYRYHPGEYLMAFHPKSSERNERNTTVLCDATGVRILMRQIAGFLARRIIFYPDVGQCMKQGREFGFIRFGSRVDLFLPLDAQIHVAVGDQVVGGRSVLATYRPPRAETQQTEADVAGQTP